MKRMLLVILTLGLILIPLLAAAEVRTYTEMVTVKVEDDEYTARKRQNSGPASRPSSTTCGMPIPTGPPPLT